MTSDFSPEVEIQPVRACAMHPAIIIGTVRSLWTWLWGRYHVPQNAFLVYVLKSGMSESHRFRLSNRSLLFRDKSARWLCVHSALARCTFKT